MAAKTYTYSQWRFIFFVVRKLQMKTKKEQSNEITEQHFDSGEVYYVPQGETF